MSAAVTSAEFIGVVRGNEGPQTLLASVFGTKTSLNKSIVERNFIDTCAKQTPAATLKSKTEIPNTQGAILYLIYNQARGCFIGCAAKAGFPERVAWDTLRAAAEEVVKVSQDEVKAGRPLGLNRVLRDPLQKALNGGKNDKLMQAQNKVDDTKAQMGNNMEKVMANVEGMQDLEAAAKDLEDNSKQYQNNATKMKTHYMKQYWYVWGLIALVIVLLIIFLAVHFS